MQILPGEEKNVFQLPEQNIFSVFASIEQIRHYFIDDNRVLSIDIISQKPTAELGVPGFDLSANKVNIVHNLYADMNGAGQHVSIKEENYDTTDIDLKGRMDPSPLASSNISNHANFMATIIAGGGNSVWYAKGAAWGANISSSSFANLLPDPAAYYLQQKISVQNHSYGTLIDNNYGVSAVAFDNSAHLNPNLLHVFSAGNDGASASTVGPYAGVKGYATITGNFKMSKNALVVGGVDSLGNVAPQSSRGPAYDGRIKPEIVAFQLNGTSESAALVSGTAILLQQFYQLKHKDSLLPSSLLKAILINTADDLNTPGPDFASGFGNLNALKAMKTIEKNSIFFGNISQHESQSFIITIPKNSKTLKVTIAWNDLASQPMIPKALINDLDLSIKNVQTNEITAPWVLHTFPNADSLGLKAYRGRDSLNNVEQVTLDNPPEGNYQVNIYGYDVTTSKQPYYIAYAWDSLNSFQFTRPSKVDVIIAGENNIIRWETTLKGNASIEYSYPPFTDWKTISNSSNLSKNYLNWNTPDTISNSILRLKSGNQFYYSDTFLITKLTEPHTGFICGDSLLIFWNKIKGISNYELYTLGNKYLMPLLTTNDTSVVINKNLFNGKFIAVAPVLSQGLRGAKSYAFNYTLQGAGCYINSFIATNDGPHAMLKLELGTKYLVDSIFFEKIMGDQFIILKGFAGKDGLSYNLDINPLPEGLTTFRTVIKLKTGQIIYSVQQSIIYVPDGKYLIAPNPVKRGHTIAFYTSVPDGQMITIFDVTGRRLFVREIQSVKEELNTGNMPSGLYFYVISKAGKNIVSGKILVVN
ncbi:MAG: S8 family peptidase [Ginsengibacter sp.]